MRYAIGLIFFGLLFRYGSADVSHLATPHHSQYLPPANRNLPIEQDYNGIDSHHNNGYLPPDSGNQNGNHGYLPPHHEQNHHQHSHRDQHNHHDHQDHQDHHGYQVHHDDHSQNHHHDQQHQHDHQLSFHNSDHRNHHDYDPSVQVSYHTDYAVNQQHDHQHTHNDHLHGQDNHQDNYDNSHNDHLDIDQQQLDPVLPSSLPVQSYLPPHRDGDQVNPSQAPRHQNSVYNNPRSFTPAYSTSEQVSHSPQNGYDYSPPAIQPAESLYPNQVDHTNNAGPLVADGHQHLHQGLPHPSNVGHTAPNNSNRDHHGESNQGYVPPRQSSHGKPGVLGHNSGQVYLPPTQLHHGDPTSLQQEQHAATLPSQDYLPPSQGNHQAFQSNHAGPGGSHEQGYLPPPQSTHQDYHPRNQGNHGSHLSHASPTGLQQINNAQGYLPPSHEHHAPYQAPQQDYLPPSHSNHGSSGNLPFLDDHTGHAQRESTHLPQNYVSTTNLPFLDDLRGQQEPQQNYQDYLPPRQSSFGSHTNGRQNQEQNAPDLPNSSQLGSLHRDDDLEARSRPTVRGHVNVPLPIPQVGYFFLPGTVSRIPSLNTRKSEEGLRPALNILLPHTNHPAEKRASDFSIVPSIQTQQDHHAQQNPQNEGQHIFSDLPFLPQSNLQSLSQQNQNGAYHPEDRQFSSPDNLSNRGLNLQSIARSQVSSQPQGRSQFRGSSYLPPPSPLDNHQHGHTHNQAQPQTQQQTRHHQNTHADSGYLPPDSHNQVTSLQTYMNAVDPSDRYGSSQYHNPPPRQKGAPSPPATTSPPMYSKPSAVVSYAPGMAYKVSTNTLFNTLNPAAYLPALESPVPQQDHSSLNIRLNEAAMKNLAKIMPKDNTVFPLEELLDIQDADDIQNGDDIDLPQLMDQLRGRIRTVQIINNYANSVKNIKVLETADQDGVKTIKILGPSNEDPMGDHKIVHIVSKGSNPEGIRQTIKIFADHKEVSLPTQNAYLPPPAKATDSKVRESSHSKEAYRKH